MIKTSQELRMLSSNLRESRFSRILKNYFEISLLNLEAFSFHFSFSISISRPFHFTVHSRSRFQGIFISLFILEISVSISDFTLFLEKQGHLLSCCGQLKRVKNSNFLILYSTKMQQFHNGD